MEFPFTIHEIAWMFFAVGCFFIAHCLICWAMLYKIWEAITHQTKWMAETEVDEDEDMEDEDEDDGNYGYGVD